MAYFRCVGGNIRPEKTINLTLHGAKGDNIGVYDEDHSIIGSAIFDADATEKTITIDIIPDKQYAFISTVAKALDGSTMNYSKTILLTQDTNQEVNVFPDGALYWYGNQINVTPVKDVNFPNSDGSVMSFNGFATNTAYDLTQYSKIKGRCDVSRTDGGSLTSIINFGNAFNSNNAPRVPSGYFSNDINRTDTVNIRFGVFMGGGQVIGNLTQNSYANHYSFTTSNFGSSYITDDYYALWLE